MFGVLLNDGSSMLADSREARVDRTRNSLVVKYESASREVNVLVPLEDVAGTVPFNAPNPLEPPRSDRPLRVAESRPALLDILIDRVVAEARSRDYMVVSVDISRLREPPPDAILPGDISWGHPEILYVDAMYFAGLGGVTGAGVSVPIGGASVSWAPTLRKRALRKLRGGVLPTKELCTAGKRPVRASGFIEFFDLRSDAARAKFHLHVDEGKPFVPATLWIDQERRPYQWALVYFRDIWSAFPIGEQEAWERIRQPVVVYGEVVHKEMKTTEWKAACYMLVRCAGVTGR